jgi:hypothetical protein
MEINDIKKGDKVIVFDYGNEIFDELVLIILNNVIDNIIIYQRTNGEKIEFSGQGYFDVYK